MSKQFSLGKDERLKSLKQIEQIFNSGKKFNIPPFRVHYSFSDEGNTLLQFGAGVSNKNFKKAVDRNRVKRLTREAYRQQKPVLQQKLKKTGESINLFFIYTGKELPVFNTVWDAVGKILDKLCGIIEKKK
jgi:ribonuclease P protein component